MSKVNICGVSEYKFTHNGWCHECKNHCEMIPEVLINDNVYQWAKNHGVIPIGLSIGSFDGMFRNSLLEDYFTTESKYINAPQYIKDYMIKHKLTPNFVKEKFL